MQEGALWTTNEGKNRMGRGSWWGVMGNFGQGQTIRAVAQETLTSLCSKPPPRFAPSKSFQSRQGRSVAQSDGCLFFCLAVQYGPSLWRLDKTWAGQKNKGPAIAARCKIYFWVGVLLLGVLGESPRGFLSNVSAAGQRGDMVSGAWEWPAWDGFISAPLSCQS